MLRELAKKQADRFVNDNEEYMRCLPVCDAPKSILSGYYEALVWMGKIVKLENMALPDKKNIHKMAKEFAAGRLKNNDSIIKLCKCLLAMEYILNQ